MRHRLPIILSVTAVVIALFGSTPLGQTAANVISQAVPLARVALVSRNARRLDGHRASIDPIAGQIPVLNATGKLSPTILPTRAGAPGTGGLSGVAAPSGAFSAYRYGPTPVSIDESPYSLATLTIPAPGSYVIVATAYADDTLRGYVTDVTCTLLAGSDRDATEVTLTGSGADVIEYQSIALSLVHQYSAAGVVDLECMASTGATSLRDVRITAIEVSSLTNTASGGRLLGG